MENGGIWVFFAWEALRGRDGHAVGRELLAELYHQATHSPMPPIATTKRGKPYFENSEWHFSIAHTKNHAFCVLCKHNVGLDAEEMTRRVSPALEKRYLSDTEQALLGEDKSADVLRLWVLKEAEAKRTGQGIGNWMKTTSFSPRDPRIQEIDGCYVAILEDNDVI